MWLSWYRFLKSSTWQLRRKIKEMHISLVKNFRRLKGGELRGVWQESLEKENSSQGLGDHQWWEHMVPPSSSRRFRSVLARRLISELGSFTVPFPPPRWYWSLLVGLTSQLWAWLFNDGSFHKWGWLLISWVFRGWPLRGWNTQSLTSPHRWDFQRFSP